MALRDPKWSKQGAAGKRLQVSTIPQKHENGENQKEGMASSNTKS
jgi:hypothetical protein